jgi:hypothetical protein
VAAGFGEAAGRLWFAVIVLSLALLPLASACGEGEEEAATPPATAPVTAAATPGPSQTPPLTPSMGRVTVRVYFLDEEKFIAGTPPFVVPLEREVEATTVAFQTLEGLFAGPTPEEQARGLRFINSGATGFSDFTVEDGIATLRLSGGCDSGGSTFTVAQEIIPTLAQFSNIQYVKILDPQGSTENPDGPGDSIPTCLEP